MTWITLFVLFANLLTVFVTRSEYFHTVIVGDSLVTKPIKFHNFTDKMVDHWKDFNSPFDLIVNEFGFHKIGNLREKNWQWTRMFDHKIDAVIVFWDSDIADVHEELFPEDRVVELRANYTRDLQFVIKKFLALGIQPIIAGPGILGEGKKKGKGCPKKFLVKGKEKMADDYR